MVDRLTSTQAKVWVMFAYFPTVSRNILREICVYLADPSLLPCISGNTLHLYDLSTKEDTVVLLSHTFDDLWMYCNVDNRHVLGVNDDTALAISLINFEITHIGTLNNNRLWPGMGWAAPYVYIFGGGFSPARNSCEKLQWRTKIWRSIGNIKSHMSSFTPCRVRDEFYLCCFKEDRKPCEAFHLITETFRDLPMTSISNPHGCVSCLVGDSIYTVIRSAILLQWKLDQTELEKPYRHINVKGYKSLDSSNIPPVCVGRRMYWVSYTKGYLVCLDIDTDRVEINRWEGINCLLRTH